MDLGLSAATDFLSPSGFSLDEIGALINPTHVTVPRSISAIQVLLNQGAEYLSQKTPSALEYVQNAWQSYLHTKSNKILGIMPASDTDQTCQNPLVCSFDIGASNTGFIAFDWRMSYVLIDALLGGINGVSIEKKQDEPYSDIEKNILQPIFEHMLNLLSQDRNVMIKTTGVSAAFPMESEAHKKFVFFVRTPSVSGKIFLSLPCDLVPQPVQENFFLPETLPLNIPIEIQASIGDFESTLSEVLSWQVGTQLILGNSKAVQGSLTVSGKTVAEIAPIDTSGERQVIVETAL